MAGDTTRDTFNKNKHFSAVLMQQGRVQLDADWNEQVDITGHHIKTETVDVIGRRGAPMHDAGFQLRISSSIIASDEESLSEEVQDRRKGGARGKTAQVFLNSPNELLISPGRYYVDGILCENEKVVSYRGQPDLPDAPAISLAGVYLAYLDVWPREITALEDPQIREVALGGPDTGTRRKVVWQVKLHPVGAVGTPATCSTVFNSWNAEIAAGTGKLAARANSATSKPNDPCIIAPGAGYRRLENEHYRVEVHQPGPLGTATFKWSRDNASIATKWESQDVDKLTLSSIGRDKVLTFASGQWVELIDDTRELLGKPGTLVQLVKAEGRVLTTDPLTVIDPSMVIPVVDISKFPRNPKVRRWDLPILMKPASAVDWHDLEDGVQVRFTAGVYKTGDYWLIPARTATADVEWQIDPNTHQPATELPRGIHHSYCRLGIVEFNGRDWTRATDCRDIFPPLTELTSLFYVGGSGQQAMPDLSRAQPVVSGNPGGGTGGASTERLALLHPLTPLLQPLEVGVANGEWPVEGATVRFTIIDPNPSGQLHGGKQITPAQVEVATGANGIAACEWSLGPLPQSQRVEAVLLNYDGNPINIPIHFNANLSVADQVAYYPKGCGSLANEKTVQDAVDRLSSLVSLFSASGDNQSDEAGKALANPLVVVAASKCGPADGMRVTFTVKAGGGTLQIPPTSPFSTSVDVPTGPLGEASCIWTLGPGPGTQIVEAELRRANASQAAPVPPTKVWFTARLRDPGFHVTGLFFRQASPNALLAPLRNDMEVPVSLFKDGFQIEFDDSVDRISFINKPVCFVTLEIPFFDQAAGTPRLLAGFQPLILDGKLSYGLKFSGSPSPLDTTPTAKTPSAKAAPAQIVDDKRKIVWTPSTPTQLAAWIKKVLASLDGTNKTRLLARLTLTGNFIWAEGKPEVYLDGEVFGVVPSPLHDLRLPSGDRKRGGDLDAWFWVKGDPVAVAPRSLQFPDIQGAGSEDLRFTIRNNADEPFSLEGIQSTNPVFTYGVGPVVAFNPDINPADSKEVLAEAAAPLSAKAAIHAPLPTQPLPVQIGQGLGVTVTVRFSCGSGLPASYFGKLIIKTDPSVDGSEVQLAGTCLGAVPVPAPVPAAVADSVDKSTRKQLVSPKKKPVAKQKRRKP